MATRSSILGRQVVRDPARCIAVGRPVGASFGKDWRNRGKPRTLAAMTNAPASKKPLVSVHTRKADGTLSAPLGTAEVVRSNVVILRGVGTLRLPIVVVAEPGAMVARGASRARPTKKTFDVALIHVPEGPAENTKDVAPVLALELAADQLVCPPRSVALKASRSWWCVLFPRLPGCDT